MRLVALITLSLVARGQQQPPNLTMQREAMKKLEFLVGKWAGEGTVTRTTGPMKLRQSEDIQLKLDGLLLLVEGTGRDEQGQVVFRALATATYDDQARVYRWRAHSEGRYLETELKVTPGGFAWSYDAGPYKVVNTMNLTPKGEWHEITEITSGNNPPRKTLEMTLKHTP
jgi:hypothetical protein